MKKIFAILFLSALALAGCSTSNSAVTKVSAPEFLSKISASDVVIVDVRTPEEFAAGHLPNAVNINVDAEDFDAQIASLDKATTYGVYCRSGNRSGVASKKMANAGFTSVINSTAGLDELVANGAMAVTN
jgi:rhodanese-related sulfurtransferase